MVVISLENEINMEDYKKIIEDAREKINSTFSGLIFKEDTHQYFLPNSKGELIEYDCVSNFTKQWDTIDWGSIAEKYARKHGNTPEYWRSEWRKKGDAACEMGTTVHEYAESLGWLSIGDYTKITPSAVPQYDWEKGILLPKQGFDKLSLKEKAAFDFWNNMHPDLHFVMAETKVFTFCDVYPTNYAGTFDLLMYYDNKANPDNSGFVIMDYKGFPLDTPILTPKGFVKMGDLKEGMEVFDKDGNPSKILHCSSIHHNPCYRINFKNGISIVADEEHRWLLENGEVITTLDMKSCRESGVSIVIPNKSGIKFAKEVGEILLSMANHPSISQRFVRERPNLGTRIVLDDKVHFMPGGDLYESPEKMANSLFYILSAGYVSDYLEYNHLCNSALSNKIYTFLESLGLSADFYGYDKNLGSFIKIPEFEDDKKPIQTYFECIVRFARYLINPDECINRSTFEVESVEQVETVPTRCIEVDSPSHTYLAGPHCIVTHNTNKSLKNAFSKEYLARPFSEFKEEALSHYTLQLSCYQVPLEAIGLKVIARRLIHLKDNGTYELVPVPNVTERIKDVLSNPKV